MAKFIRILLLLLIGSVSAQAADKPSVPAIPGSMKSDQVDGFVAPLTDAQTREILVNKLKADAAAATAPAEMEAASPSIQERIRERAGAVLDRIDTIQQATSDAPHAFFIVLRNLTDQQGWPAVGRALLVLLVMLVGGRLVEWGLRRATRRTRKSLTMPVAGSELACLGIHLVGVALELICVMAFIVTAYGISFIFFERFDPLRDFVMTYLLVVGIIRLVGVIARAILGRSSLAAGIEGVRGRQIQRIRRYLIVLAGVVAFAFLSNSLLRILGLDEELRRAFRLLCGLGAALVMLGLVWAGRGQQARDYEEAAIVGARAALAQVWHVFAIAYLVATWAVWSFHILLDEFIEARATVFSVLVLFAFPVIDLTLRANQQDEAREIKDRKYRMVRFLAYAVFGLLFLYLSAEAWGLDSYGAMETSLGKAVARAVINITAALLAAAIAWQVTKTLVDRNTPHFDVVEEELTPATRGQTLLPLLRSAVAVMLLIVVTMIVLSSLGVDIGPLLAGAGIIGLAIGFGAQALVRDIVSGIFFLMEDAFRIGEYVDTGRLRGTVEAISIRSMRLRHHRGALHTVPFGGITALTNQSRDWVIEKLEFGVVYGTDVEKVRKIIKSIGQEMLEDPELAPAIIEPLKSQGVRRIGEGSLILRAKFKTKPSQQFLVRRQAFRRIHEEFAAKGILLATPTVSVAGDGGGFAPEVAASASATTRSGNRQAVPVTEPLPP